ncbi:MULTISPECIES: hypothetical protein [unclassified Bradyrhizobium]|uniref:hypothetical protein n=1 Tax=unclassified Bradyrhizobium TaxID=2631580 RepID=UPI00093AC7AA|nr:MULTISPECIES: hypothetical protein [unclassified Bradyrhizobium]OKO79012.1 hypothetical protein AC629_29455 [Bradyrhizobium sp. NAS80.1]OKO80649.1 hypothetical protein AC630_15330 [Bradyrhizobium sp. AS23.2]
MTRLPQRSVEPWASFRGPNVDNHTPTTTPTIPKAEGSEIERTHANGGKSHTIFQDTDQQDVAVGATIETALELNSVHPVSRINVNEARTQIGEIKPGPEIACLNGPTLADNLLSFVTPRLRHSDVLRPEKQGVLLERLADALSAAPDGWASREDMEILQLELRRLILLRQNHNGLIKG